MTEPIELPSCEAPRLAVVPSDQSLLREVRCGDEQAAAAIYERYAERLHALARARCSSSLARRVDAEDIVQSVFSSFFRGLNQGHYQVAPGADLWRLLLVIALNKIRAQGNFHRACKRDVRRSGGVPEAARGSSGAHDPDGPAVAFLRMVIAEAVEHLPEKYREIALLRIEGYEVAEIAARVGRSPRTVERVLQQFRQRLARTLELKQD